jgi:hypothetical protein
LYNGRTLILEVWNDEVKEAKFIKSEFSGKVFDFPDMSITFSPHEEGFANKILTKMSNRIKQETSSVIFAVMDTDPKGADPVFPALREVHKSKKTSAMGYPIIREGCFFMNLPQKKVCS